MRKGFFIIAFILIQVVSAALAKLYAQEISILNYTTNESGQVQIEVASSPEKYYILKIRNNTNAPFDLYSSMTLGEHETTVLSESLSAYPQEHYQVLEYSLNTPVDTDDDGIDDFSEYNNSPSQNPLNSAESITRENGMVLLESSSDFSELSVKHETVQWSEYLNGKEFLKFIILDFGTSNPKTYFINTNTYSLHIDFAEFLNIDFQDPDIIKGHIIYHPTVMADGGTLGTYAYNFTNGESKPFEKVQKTQELLAANMTFLKNNLSYFVLADNEDEYFEELNLYQNSRVSIVFESDIYAGINYWGLNQAEGYGYFREASLSDVPDSKDIVLYSSLPNSLPRVGGIITSVIQTPLSHVNLRAIQDNIPNAFIRDPLSIDSIFNLLNHPIYFKVEQSKYIIREATTEEVNNWYENSRPTSEQVPPLNLDYISIQPLDQLTFDMFDGFGYKCVNLATMRTFGFPEKTIPDGFGIPFYFYQEFMKYNHFFDDVRSMLANSAFNTDREVRDEMLKDFRKKITEASMPTWMSNEMTEMQNTFPTGISIRCRSSSNNEDLPGFSGAGLYDSKTQHPDEGHIAKSIKQVYASLWNLRAFDERTFYKINHYASSMGVLCHANYSDEKVNGVGVSADPVYNTENNFYLNSQLGEDLITNPGENSKPEELLLNRFITDKDDYLVIQYSSLLSSDSVLMSEMHLAQMRDFLTVIHDEFEKLYHAEDNSSFAMDIEYKITSSNQLIIKQARPWVSYVFEESISNHSEGDLLVLFPNPAKDYLNITCKDCHLDMIRITDIRGKLIMIKEIQKSLSPNTHITINHLPNGFYILSGFKGNERVDARKFVKSF